MIRFDSADRCDFLLVSGDAFVDHPSFGAAVIARVLEAEGFSVAVLCQPDWHGVDDFVRMGRPRLGALVTAGNLDSMVAHYTVAKKRRSQDAYTQGGVAGKRPNRALIVYANLVRQSFPGLPVVLGGLEASLRRFAHYDYWEDAVRRSALLDAKADILVYGMGERAIRDIAARLRDGAPLEGIRGTCVTRKTPPNGLECPSFEEVRDSRESFARAVMLQNDEHDPVRGRTLLQKHGDTWLVCHPPARPLTTPELDAVAELPYTRAPMNTTLPVPAIEEVQFSLIHNRGCFGGCHFCSLSYHQGRMISTRSRESVLREAAALTRRDDFKGYIHDVGGPTANMGHCSCEKQKKQGLCKRNCLTPTPCPHVDSSHTDYLRLLRALRALPGVKKVFVRSGVRYDYLLLDQSGQMFSELVEHHVSGQLKVAPEHCVDSVLDYMGKPHWSAYRQFEELFERLNRKAGKKQFLVPYFISSHPGCTLEDAVNLAETLHKMGCHPEQVQDFYPTPGTLSTCMYHTGLDPRTLEPVFVAKTPRDKALQRALLQVRNPKNRGLVEAALLETGREDLIGYGKRCLIRPRGSPSGAPGKKRRP